MTKSRVQHIMRLAVQDWRTSKVRARSFRAADPLLRLVYLEALVALYEFGGELPADPESLADILLLPVEDIARCLPILAQIGGNGRGGLIVSEKTITNRRVTEDLEGDRKYREQQADIGRRGGFAKGSPGERQANAKATPGHPYPSPEPLPEPKPEPETSCAVGSATTAGSTGRKPTPQQEKVQAVFDVFDRYEATKPSGGVVAKWLALYDGDHAALAMELDDMAGSGMLGNDVSYLFKVLKTRHTNPRRGQIRMPNFGSPARRTQAEEDAISAEMSRDYLLGLVNEAKITESAKKSAREALSREAKTGAAVWGLLRSAGLDVHNDEIVQRRSA